MAKQEKVSLCTGIPWAFLARLAAKNDSRVGFF